MSAPRPDYAAVRFGGRNGFRGERQKSEAKFNLCENSEENAIFVPLSISNSGALNSEQNTPPNMPLSWVCVMSYETAKY